MEQHGFRAQSGSSNAIYLISPHMTCANHRVSREFPTNRLSIYIWHFHVALLALFKCCGGYFAHPKAGPEFWFSDHGF